MTNPSSGPGLTPVGKIFSVLLVIGVLALGGWVVMKRFNKPGDNATTQTAKTGGTSAGGGGGVSTNTKFDTSDLVETEFKQPKLDPPGTYVPKDNVIDIELSQYAGYAGLIVANGGLQPNDNSYFQTKHGFKVRIKISEEESWSALNAGKMAASATTADVLAAYGRQFQVVVPAQIGYSRGADGIVVRSDIKKLNDLKGKTVVSCQFTESDFLLRYLAGEANVPLKMLTDISAAPDPESINVVFAKDGLAAGSAFEKALAANSSALAGCVTWAPKTTEIPANNPGKAKLLVSNKNLLLVADVLIVNKGFAEKNPKIVEGLVDGLLHGNQMVRENPEANADVIGAAMKWEGAKTPGELRTRTLAELQKVHLSNLPEQQAFLSGKISEGGSFANIFDSSVEVYSKDFKALTENPVDSSYFVNTSALKKAADSGDYKAQVAAIVPRASQGGAVAEIDPVLSKDIRFLFKAMSHDLDMANVENQKNLDAIKRILDISPGSRIMLVGHVDPTGMAAIRKQYGEAGVASAAKEAKQLSLERAIEIRDQLMKRFSTIEPKRLDILGMGWDQPVTQKESEGERNRRVEVRWWTLE